MRTKTNIAICLGITVLMIIACGSSVFAETYKNNSDWRVTFTKNKDMVETYNTKDFTDIFQKAEPGDTVTIKVSQKNNYSKSTDWYMHNDVLRTLEQGCVAANGAYSYKLTYTNPGGQTKVLYDSKKVGGGKNGKVSAAGQGLKEATNSLQDWFYMDTLKPGQKSFVTLQIKLEGQTQSNIYQNTLGQVELQWAVELTGSGNNPNNVKTGDSMNMLLWAIIAFICGIIILIILITSLRRRKDEGGTE